MLLSCYPVIPPEKYPVKRTAMKPKSQSAFPASSPAPRLAYERPRLVRVAIHTTRENLQWQYAGLTTCTNHNHTGGDAGCAYPQ